MKQLEREPDWAISKRHALNYHGRSAVFDYHVCIGDDGFPNSRAFYLDVKNKAIRVIYADNWLINTYLAQKTTMVQGITHFYASIMDTERKDEIRKFLEPYLLLFSL
jgi:hypothetical protein